MQSLKSHLQEFCIIDLTFTQSGPGCEFFPMWRTVAVPSCAVDFFARRCCSRSAVDGGAWGGSFCAMELIAIGNGRRRVEARFSRWSPSRLRSAADGSAWRPEGFLSRSMEHIWREEKSRSRGGPGDYAIGLLPSRPQLGNYAKFAFSFVKLSKMQTPNAKPLDILFYDFWQITRMQT